MTPAVEHAADRCYFEALDDEPSTVWPPERVAAVEKKYQSLERKLLLTHPTDDDEGLARKLSALRALIGY